MVGVFSSLIRLWGAFLSIMRLICGAFSSFIRFGGSSSAASCSDVGSDGSCSDVASDGSCSSSYDDDINQTQKYHVFLSFRGKDTREKFTSHLHHALCDKGIETYIDYRLKNGDKISPALLKAIESSKIAVIIFSKNYASSAWCLDELLHIVNCKLEVIPIFYGVDPADVRRHKGTYGTGLGKLRQRLPDKLDAWKKALVEVANLVGYDSKNYGLEAEFVKKIVHDISEKLDSLSVCDDFHLPNLVGVSEHIAHIQSQLAIGSQDVRIIGIWGIGGIGKTTIAQTLYDRIKSQFEGKCFLPNIREILKNQGKGYLQKKLFLELLKEENPKLVRNRLCSMKVLLVLDDVDNSNIQPELFETLKQGWFGLESRIIVTTRNKQVLQNIGADDFYEVPLLDLKKGFELFQLKAFRNNTPPVEYMVLIERFVHYAGGLPLALKVLASSLCNRSVKEWESALVKLQKFPNCDINAVLRWSFDGLDQQEKDIFLDIACFFKGKPINWVARILEDSCGADIGISVLNDKSLIYINLCNNVEMHDLVQQMGWNITREECIEEPGKRKRIFMADDVQHILEENTGTPSIRGIALNTYHIKDVVELKATCFSNMPNLKFLWIYDSSHFHKVDNKLKLPEGLNGLPRGLRYLEWKGYSYKYLPSKLCLRNLVEFIMPDSMLQQLWKGALPLDRLKKINLEYSTHLIEFPDISRAPELEVINLKGCERLFSTFFVKEISDMGSHIKELNLSGCKSIETMPSSIECLRSLVKLDLSYCCRLKSIPASICKLKSLEELHLQWCVELEKFVEILEPMKHLCKLVLSGTSIKELGTSIQNLVGLKNLDLSMCKKLQFLPTSIQNLVGLKNLDLSMCKKLQFLPTSLSVCLDNLDVTGCKRLKSLLELPPSIGSLIANGCLSLRTISILGGRPIFNMESKPYETETYYSFLNCPKLEQSAFDNIMTITLPTNLSHFPSGTYIPLNIFASRWSGNQIPKWTVNESWVSVELLKGFSPEWSGNQIPKWMEDKSNESWVRVELPQNWSAFDHQVFSICLVPSPPEASSNLFVDMTAVYQSENGFHIRSYTIYINVEDGSDLKFKYRCSTGLHLRGASGLCHCINQPTEVFFYFSAFMGHAKDVNKSVKIKKCEAHLLSLEDVSYQPMLQRLQYNDYYHDILLSLRCDQIMIM